MKKGLLLIASFFVFATAAFAADRIVTVDQMPAAAQQFIKKYLPDQNVSYVKYDPEFFSSSYDAVFADGTKVEFDGKGNMMEYETVAGAVPTELLPAPVVTYVSKTFPDATVKSLDIDRWGYEVKLSNGLELKFNNEGQLVEIDD